MFLSLEYIWAVVAAGLTKLDSEADSELGLAMSCIGLRVQLAGNSSGGLIVQELNSVSTCVSAGPFLVGRLFSPGDTDRV